MWKWWLKWGGELLGMEETQNELLIYHSHSGQIKAKRRENQECTFESKSMSKWTRKQRNTENREREEGSKKRKMEKTEIIIIRKLDKIMGWKHYH